MAMINDKSVKVRLVNEYWVKINGKNCGKDFSSRYYWKTFSNIEALHQFLLKYNWADKDKLGIFGFNLEEDLSLNQYLSFMQKRAKYFNSEEAFSSSFWVKHWNTAQRGKKRIEAFKQKYGIK